MSDEKKAPSKTPSRIQKTLEVVKFHSPSKSKVRNRISDFFITMNTNKRIDGVLTGESPLVTILEASAREVFGDEGHFLRFVTFPQGGQWDDDHIVALNVVTGVEIGTDDAHGKRLHLHAQFKVTHRSYIKLDFHALQAEMNKVLRKNGYPLEIHYTHVTFHRSDMAREYIGKI